MSVRLLADAVVVVHFGFIIFVAVGPLLAWRWRHLVWLHGPALGWAALTVAVGVPCPLTLLEKGLRGSAGEQGYDGGFVNTYIENVIYPGRYTPHLRALAVGLIVVGYAGLRRRAHVRASQVCGADPTSPSRRSRTRRSVIVPAMVGQLPMLTVGSARGRCDPDGELAIHADTRPHREIRVDVVGEGGLEPPASCSQSRCATTALLPGVAEPSQRVRPTAPLRFPAPRDQGLVARRDVPESALYQALCRISSSWSPVVPGRALMCPKCVPRSSLAALAAPSSTGSTASVVSITSSRASVRSSQRRTQ